MSFVRRLATLALAGVVLVGCNEVDAEKKLAFEDPLRFAEAMDAWAQEELADGNHQEARDWLTKPGHLLFEGEPAAAQEVIDGLYERGAESVRFTSIQTIGNAQVSAAIAAQLPADPNARAALLAFEAQAMGRDEPLPDFGQRYLGFSFD